jgi:hypothetical protein
MTEERTLDEVVRRTPDKREKNPHVWPDLPFLELMCAIAVTLALATWSLWLDAPLGEIATPSRTENPAKAPWYFVGLQEILVYFDPWFAGVVLPGVIILGLMAIPYLDHNPKGVGEYNFPARRFAVVNFMFGYLLWMGAIVVGQFMRGPSWHFFWPWQTWDPNYHPPAAELHNFPLPFAVAVICVYFAMFYVSPIMLRLKIYTQLDWTRYVILTSLMALMYAVPAKIVLRQVFHIRYVLVTPWFSI